MEINNTDDVFDLIEQVAALPGKNDKIALLKEHASANLLRAVLEATYNPLTTYGLRKVPGQNHEAARTTGSFSATTWAVLSGMKTRHLTGNSALGVIQDEMNELSSKSAELFKRIILKDMRAGFSEETVNKVWPKLLPDFPYQRCCLPKDSKIKEWIETEGAISQEKADGLYLNADHEASGEVILYTRAGSMFPMDKFEPIASAIKSTFLRGTQTHGELLVMRMSGAGEPAQVLSREVGNGILNSVLKGGSFAVTDYPVFLVWDQIPRTSVVAKGSYDTPYRARLASLISQVKDSGAGFIRVIPTRVVKNLAEAYEHAGEIMAAGGEGTIVKRKSAIWKDGTSKEQVKLKLEFEVDLVVNAILPGEDNTKNEGRPGRIACSTSCGGLLVNVAVKNESMRAALEKDPQSWIGSIMPVTANLIMAPSESNAFHSLFLPRFSQDTARVDKFEADSLERAFEIQEAAKLGQKLLAAVKVKA